MSAMRLSVHSGVLGASRSGSIAGLRTYTAKVDIKALKRLRELNPVPMSKAKEALLSTDNDINRALKWIDDDSLRSGAIKAEKVKDRAASEGAVAVQINDALTAAAMVEVGCETDFVARNAMFVDLASSIAQSGLEIAASRPAGCSGLSPIELEQLSVAQLACGRAVADIVTETIGRLGENIVLRRGVMVGSASATDSIVVSGYIHSSVAGSNGALAGKIGGLVAIRSAVRGKEHRHTLSQLARRLAQQVVGYSPRYATIGEWREAKAGGVEDPGDPEVSVLEAQQFLFGGGTVAEVLAKVAKGVGAPVEVASFVRYERGEGVEKAAMPDFVEQVRQQLA